MTETPTLAEALIGGVWRDDRTRAHASIPVADPYRDVELARLVPASSPTVYAAVEAAAAALPAWSSTSGRERGTVLAQVATAMREHAASLLEQVVEEVGTPLPFAEIAQVALPAQIFDVYADMAPVIDAMERHGRATVVRDAAGVVAAITPWNYPLLQGSFKLAAALAAGCTVVWKPSEVAPLTAMLFARLLTDVDLPAGVVNVVLGDRETGEHLVAHPRVDLVSFTGSTEVGRHVAATAGQRLARVCLELGGKSPSVVLPEADLEGAVVGTLNNALRNGGQTCTALSRLLVPEARLDDAVEISRSHLDRLKLGDPRDPSTDLGPLVSRQHQRRVHDIVQSARMRGIEVVAERAPDTIPSQGAFVGPVVFHTSDVGDPIVQEEVFGPVVVIQPYRDLRHAVELANCTRYGLSACVWASDDEQATVVARQIRAGQVDINGGGFDPCAPFGGVGDSGIGRELGVHGLLEFTEPKSLRFRA